MALFTDGPISDIQDLTAQDPQLPNVANVEGIGVTQKLLVAQEDIGLEVTELLVGSGRADRAIWLSAQLTLDNIVVTPALRLWHSFRSLEMFYADAYSGQLNDRYAAKRDHFHERSKWAYDRLLLAGLGIAPSPIPRAIGPQIVNTEGSLANGTYYVATTWVNGRGEEGAPSVVTENTTSGSTMLVQPAAAPASMSGWNVYVGSDPESLCRQNGTPIGIGQAWLQPNSIVSGGIGPGSGQAPTYLMAIPRMILRG